MCVAIKQNVSSQTYEYCIQMSANARRNQMKMRFALIKVRTEVGFDGNENKNARSMRSPVYFLRSLLVFTRWRMFAAFFVRLFFFSLSLTRYFLSSESRVLMREFCLISFSGHMIQIPNLWCVIKQGQS